MRKEALAAVPGILASLLAEEADDFDAKELETDADEEGTWEQVDGDYGDPWEYGGCWYNFSTRELLYFEGLETMEQLGYREVKPEDVELPASLEAALSERYPLHYEDPEGDEDAARQQREQNERERYRIIDNYQLAKSELLNRRKAYPVHSMSIDPEDGLGCHLERELPRMASTFGMTVEQFKGLPLPNQWVEVFRYYGVDEFCDRTLMTKRELEAKLGFSI